MAPDRAARPVRGLGHLGVVLRAAFAALGLAVVFVVALVAGVALHLNLGPVRRVVASRVDALLGPTFQGKLAIDSVGRIDFDGVDEGNVRILDPSGKLVAAAYGVRARIALGELLRSLTSGDGPIVIHITEVSVKAVDFGVDVDAEGKLGIQRALAPRPTPSSGAAGARREASRLTRSTSRTSGFTASRRAGFPVDADVDSLHGRVAVDTAGSSPQIAIDVASFSLLTRDDAARARDRGSARGAPRAERRRRRE